MNIWLLISKNGPFFLDFEFHFALSLISTVLELRELVLERGRVVEIGADVSWNCHDVGYCPYTETYAPRLK